MKRDIKKTGTLVLILWALLFVVTVLQYINIIPASFIFIYFLVVAIVLITHLIVYVLILLDIIKKGSNAVYITFWIICLILLPCSLLFVIVYLFAGQERQSEKSLMQKAKVNVVVSGTKNLDKLDRPIRKTRGTQYCKDCGKKIKKGSKFCQECGKKQ